MNPSTKAANQSTDGYSTLFFLIWLTVMQVYKKKGSWILTRKTAKVNKRKIEGSKKRTVNFQWPTVKKLSASIDVI